MRKIAALLALLLMVPHSGIAAGQASFGHAVVDAADQGIGTLVMSLVKNGNDVNARGDFGVTPLMRAAYRGYPDIIEMLVAMGADVNLADTGGATALHLAARQGQTEAVKQLIRTNAQLEIQDSEGWTPLMRAVAGQHIDVARALVNAGANAAAKNAWGESAMTLAQKSPQRSQLIPLMQQASAPSLPSAPRDAEITDVPIERVLPRDLPKEGTINMPSLLARQLQQEIEMQREATQYAPAMLQDTDSLSAAASAKQQEAERLAQEARALKQVADTLAVQQQLEAESRTRQQLTGKLQAEAAARQIAESQLMQAARGKLEAEGKALKEAQDRLRMQQQLAAQVADRQQLVQQLAEAQQQRQLLEIQLQKAVQGQQSARAQLSTAVETQKETEAKLTIAILAKQNAEAKAQIAAQSQVQATQTGGAAQQQIASLARANDNLQAQLAKETNARQQLEQQLMSESAVRQQLEQRLQQQDIAKQQVESQTVKLAEAQDALKVAEQTAAAESRARLAALKEADAQKALLAAREAELAEMQKQQPDIKVAEENIAAQQPAPPSVTITPPQIIAEAPRPQIATLPLPMSMPTSVTVTPPPADEGTMVMAASGFKPLPAVEPLNPAAPSEAPKEVAAAEQPVKKKEENLADIPRLRALFGLMDDSDALQDRRPVAGNPIITASLKTPVRARITVGEAVAVPLSPPQMLVSETFSPRALDAVQPAAGPKVWLEMGPFARESEALNYFESERGKLTNVPRRIKVVTPDLAESKERLHYLRIGPYPTDDVAQDSCTRLKGETQGLDCQLLHEEVLGQNDAGSNVKAPL